MKHLTLLLSLLLSMQFFAQTDGCGSPTPLAINASCTNTAYSVPGSFTNGGVASATCATGSDRDDGWFLVTGNGSSIIITASAVGESVCLAAWTGCGTGQVACTFINAGSSGSISFFATNGTSYYIQLHRQSGNGTANLSGNICAFTAPPPANDNCASATTLTVNAGTTCTTSTNGTVEYATASSQASSCAGAAGDDDDVWYSFVATSTTHTVTLSNITGSNTDLDFAIYAASCAGSEILCSQVNANTASGLTAGTTYFVRVYTATSTAGQTTDFTICVTTPPSPPSNDECAGAITLTPGGSCVFATYNNTNATASSGIPAPGCASYVGSDVWFAITVPANGSLEVDTDDLGITDGGMAAYSGTCGALSLIQCNDDGSANGLMPLLTMTGLTAGTTIYIRVWEYGGDVQGTFGICVTSPTPPTPPTPPINDDCPGATAVTVNSGATCTSTTPGTIAGSTASSEANTCGGTANDDVWYSFVATSTSHTISLLNVNGSTTDLYHSVYSGTCGSIGAPVICSDPNSSQINGLTIGNTYYVRVYSWTSTTGQTTTFDICIGTPPPPPTNVMCNLMDPICSGTPIAFTAASNGGTAEPGNNYDCLLSQPNPSWYYLEIDQGGNLVIDITAGSDVDYAIWGPYANLATAQASCGTYPLPIDCSYSSSNIEQCVVNAVTTTQVYVLLVTNYSNVVQTIFVNEAASNTASTNCAIVTLPVGLTQFNAVMKERKVQIDWITATENNSDYFEIQKSRDGKLWQTIKVKVAAGNSTSEIHYSHTDDNPFQDVSYYRLKQVDKDGSFTYSDIRSVGNNGTTETKIYPVPATKSVVIETGKMEVTELYAVDMSGNKIEMKYTGQDGKYTLDSSFLPSGFYHLHASDGNQTINFKLVIGNE